MKLLLFAFAMLIIGALYAIYVLLEFRIKLRTYGARLRNFYVYSESETDRTLIQRANEHDRWLNRADNTSGVKVIIIPFRDKLNPLETWEEYLVRRKEETRLDMIERDSEIEEGKGREYYLTEVHAQDATPYFDAVDTIENLQNRYHGLRISAQKNAASARRLWHRLSRRLQQD